MYYVLSLYLSYMIVVYVGITLGYHRYFAHRQFKASPLQEIIMLLCGTICGGRSPIIWCAVHRTHHAYADTEKDPHGHDWRTLFGMWEANKLEPRFTKDLLRNPRVKWFHNYGKYIWLISLPITLHITILSFIGFGIINYFGHKDNQPVNRWWLNLIAPAEGNHKDHHEKSKRPA